MQTPYVSIAFANRNDGYGIDQAKRFNCFIDYYSEFVKKHPGIFEFVICDWNPPSDRAPLIDAYPWERLGRVISFTVPAEFHQKFAKGSHRKIFDYVARNACIQRGTAPWSLVLNQDIFLAPKIMEFIASKKLKDDCFYRADRVDFDFSNYQGTSVAELISHAKTHVTRRHMRHGALKSSEEISPAITPAQFPQICTKVRALDKYDPKSQMISGDSYQRLHKKLCSNRKFRAKLVWKLFLNRTFKLGQAEFETKHYQCFSMHTNASGDFILAPRAAFEEIRGFPETMEFYMHTDSYGVIQLFASGYTQVIFTGEQCAFHADHPRPDRQAGEKYNYHWHVKNFCKMCYQGKSYRFNSSSWGLKRVNLPIKSAVIHNSKERA
jgi:hypothetical protein